MEMPRRAEKEEKEYNALLQSSFTLQTMLSLAELSWSSAHPGGWKHSLEHYRPDQKKAKNKPVNKKTQVGHDMLADFWTQPSRMPM